MEGFYMENQVELENYYNQIVDWYVKIYDRNTLNMEIFLGGCHLYYLGEKLGFERDTEVLVEFLLGAKSYPKSEKNEKAMQLIKKMFVAGYKNQEESIETNYNSIMKSFLKEGNIGRIIYSRFIAGYALYRLGNNLGYSTHVLGKYLDYVQVVVTEGEDSSLSVLDIRNEVNQTLENTNKR